MKLLRAYLLTIIVLYCNVSFGQLNEGGLDKFQTFLYKYKYIENGEWKEQVKQEDNLVVIDWYEKRITIYSTHSTDDIDIVPGSFKKDTTERFINYYENGVNNQNKKCAIKICYNKNIRKVFYISFDYSTHVKMYYPN